MAIRLRQMGVTDFVILDRGNDLGGTWRDNSYPGAACDVPSNLYSYLVRPQSELEPHVPVAVRDLGLHARTASIAMTWPTMCGTNHAVDQAVWDEATKEWDVTVESGATFGPRC